MLRLTPRRIIFYATIAFCTFVALLVGPLTTLFHKDLTPSWLEALLSVLDTAPSHKDVHFLAYYTASVPSRDLQARLQSLLRAPLWSSGEAFRHNVEQCPLVVGDRQVNPDQLWRHGWFWKRLRLRQILRRRIAMIKYLENAGRQGTLFATPSGSRGIVMTGGNQDTTQRLLVTLRILRKEYNCQLPVEVFAFPGEIQDPEVLHELASLSVRVREISGRIKLQQWKNYQIKAEAIILSSFQEVLYLDSDNIPLRDPSFLFETDLYAAEGQPKIVLWPDLNKDHPKNPIWRLLGKPCNRDEWEIESGQILIDKRGNNGLNMAALHLAAHMQEEHAFYFRLSEGDKDTFRYAFWALGLPFSVSPRWLSSLGFHAPWDNNRFCGIAMLQYDITIPSSSSNTPTHPQPLFVHANLLKHRKRVPASSSSLSLEASSNLNLSPFSVIKRASNDLADASSLDGARMWVYMKHGMCVDLSVRSPPGSAHLLQHEHEHGHGNSSRANQPIEENFHEVYGGAFADFTRIYLRHGGRVEGGGW